jgi:hypothetical protein
MSLIFQYKGRIRLDLYKRITEQYGDRYRITIEESRDSDAFPDCTIQIFDDLIKEEINGKKKRLNPGTDKENAEWPDPVHP